MGAAIGRSRSPRIAFVFGSLALDRLPRHRGRRQRRRVDRHRARGAGAGYIVSDFLSGFVHWAGDTVGDETTPIFGPNFVTPFRYHHVDPEDITRHDFVETNGNNCIVAAPVLLLVLLMPADDGRALLHVRDRGARRFRLLHEPIPQVGAHQGPGRAGSACCSGRT